VYKASLDGQPVAVKWYYPNIAAQMPEENLQRLISTPSPSPKFAWPLAIVKSKKVPGYGYVMPLRPEGMHGIDDLINRLVDPGFFILCTAAFHLADSFLKLHALGLCYRDLSYGNAFINPRSGDVCICDNDNVTINGDRHATVLGTPLFMAPEIVKRQAYPDANSDLYSLATLLFLLFILDHPLFGRREHAVHCLDEAAMNHLCGTNPLFIYDPNDESNRPVPGRHVNALAFWPLYPLAFRRLFTKSFTTGLRDAQNGRVRESEWRAAIVQLRDSIHYCRCGAENMYDREQLANAQPRACAACQQPLVLPPRLRTKHGIIMLNHDTKLYGHHLSEAHLYVFTKPWAEIAQHPSTGQWGLRNLSPDPWKATLSNASPQDVPNGKAVTLTDGLKLDFGTLEGHLKA